MAEKRQVFFSFCYDKDCQRAARIRNIGTIEDNAPVSDNDWESVKGGGDDAIQKWIDDQMNMRSCLILLIGTETAGRKWINYEIESAWNNNKGIVAINIHNIQDLQNTQTPKGLNPMDDFSLNGTPLINIVETYDPPYTVSKDVRNYIADNLEQWVEKAIEIRKKYSKEDKIVYENPKNKRLNSFGEGLAAALSAGALGIGAGGTLTKVAKGAGHAIKFFGTSD